MKVILEFTESQLAVLCRIASNEGSSFETMIAKAVMCYIDSKEARQDESVSEVKVSDLEQVAPTLVFRVSPNVHTFIPQTASQSNDVEHQETENDDGETITEEVMEFESEEEMTTNTTGESLFF